MDALRTFVTRFTGQRLPVDARQVPNDAGGYTFALDDAARLRRFLLLGTDGGTYYVHERALTGRAAEVVLRMAAGDHRRLVDTIVEVSGRGAAPRPNPALFALAAASAIGDNDERAHALDQLPRVARTGTHLFLFAEYVQQFRGWGRGLRRAVAHWYSDRPVDDVAYQAVKYRQREGWTHRDLLRLAHPATAEPDRAALFDWIVRGATGEATPRLVEGFRRAAEPGADVPALVAEYGLSWEMLPDAALADPAVWEALVDRGLPATALLRQLPRLTRLGLLGGGPGPDLTDVVTARLGDGDWLRRSRLHPVNILVALRTYASGHGARGREQWAPSARVVDALDAAFYAAFGTVEPTGRRLLLALDVSGSMTSPVSGLPLSCREATAALALVTAAVEPSTSIVGFTGGRSAVRPLAISARQRLDDVLRVTAGLPFGPTDCAAPMVYARERRLPVDTFVIYTDNETWYGDEHPHVALRHYRQATGIAARLVVVAMTATGFTIADPDDPGMLDVVGFDAAVPRLVSDFVAA